MLHYFKNCSSNAHPISCEDSPTKSIYNIQYFPVQSSWPSLKITNTLDKCLACSLILIHIELYSFLSYDVQTWQPLMRLRLPIHAMRLR